MASKGVSVIDIITYLSLYLGIESSIKEITSTSGIFSALSSVRVEQSRLCLNIKIHRYIDTQIDT